MITDGSTDRLTKLLYADPMVVQDYSTDQMIVQDSYSDYCADQEYLQ